MMQMEASGKDGKRFLSSGKGAEYKVVNNSSNNSTSKDKILNDIDE